MGTIVFFDKAKEELFTGGMNLSASMNCVLLDPSFAFDIDISDYSSSISPFALGNLSGTSIATRRVNGVGDIVNGLLQSNNVTTSPWSSGLGVANKNQNDIYGNANSAWQLGDDSAAATQQTQQSVALSSSGVLNHGYSGFIQKDSDETRFASFQLFILGGSSSDYVYVGINTATGNTWTIASSGTFEYDCRLYTDKDSVEWWHVRIMVTNANANTDAQCRVYPAYTATEGALFTSAAATGNIVTCGLLFLDNIASLEDMSGFYVENGASTATAAISVPDVTLSATDVVAMDLSDVVFTASSSQNFSARYACLVQSGVNTPLAYMELSTSTIVAHKIKIVWP